MLCRRRASSAVPTVPPLQGKSESHGECPTCVGSELLNVCLAKTYMIAALARGLQAAGVSFTLPPTKDGSSGDAGVAMHRLAAADGSGQGGTSSEGGNAKEDPSQGNKATAAAANLLILS
jgi:hypothetical protein